MRLMHVSYTDAIATPAGVMRRQLTFSDIEIEMKNLKAQANAKP